MEATSDSEVNDKPVGFLNLPIEIRHQIYSDFMPICRLAPFPYIDSTWSMITTSPEEYRGIPGILLTSHTIYNELAPLLYARAILEIAPTPPSHSFFDVKLASANNMIPYTYMQLSNVFRFYRSDLLKLIREVSIYSDQMRVIDGESYEALLQWLVQHTSVTTIHLAPRLMTRIRGKATFDLTTWKTNFYDRVKSSPNAKEAVRVVRLWTKSDRSPWEHEKMTHLRCTGRNKTLTAVQTYFLCRVSSSSAIQHGIDEMTRTIIGNRLLQLDPRWTTTRNDPNEKVGMLNDGISLIDEIMREVLEVREQQDYVDNTRHAEGDAWVYQMILVSK